MKTNNQIHKSNYSYLSWPLNRQTVTKTHIALTGIVSTALLGLTYFWYSTPNESSDSDQYNLCADLTNIAYEGLQTAAILAISVLQGMGSLGQLALAAHVNRGQERTNLNEVRDLKPTIIHIPQKHWVSAHHENDPTAIQRIWESQLRVLEKLLLYPNGAIFPEELTETSHYDAEEFSKFLEYLPFPEGLPEKKESWNELQKRALARFGADNILHFLGKIKTLYQTIDPIASTEITSKTKPAKDAGGTICDDGIRELIFDRREEFLERAVREFLKNPENKGRPILIIYGSAHDLSDNFANENFIRLTNEPSAEEENPCKELLAERNRSTVCGFALGTAGAAILAGTAQIAKKGTDIKPITILLLGLGSGVVAATCAININELIQLQPGAAMGCAGIAMAEAGIISFVTAKTWSLAKRIFHCLSAQKH